MMPATTGPADDASDHAEHRGIGPHATQILSLRGQIDLGELQPEVSERHHDPEQGHRVGVEAAAGGADRPSDQDASDESDRIARETEPHRAHASGGGTGEH